MTENIKEALEYAVNTAHENLRLSWVVMVKSIMIATNILWLNLKLSIIQNIEFKHA